MQSIFLFSTTIEENNNNNKYLDGEEFNSNLLDTKLDDKKTNQLMTTVLNSNFDTYDKNKLKPKYSFEKVKKKN